MYEAYRAKNGRIRGCGARISRISSSSSPSGSHMTPPASSSRWGCFDTGRVGREDHPLAPNRHDHVRRRALWPLKGLGQERTGAECLLDPAGAATAEVRPWHPAPERTRLERSSRSDGRCPTEIRQPQDCRLRDEHRAAAFGSWIRVRGARIFNLSMSHHLEDARRASENARLTVCFSSTWTQVRCSVSCPVDPDPLCA